MYPQKGDTSMAILHLKARPIDTQHPAAAHSSLSEWLLAIPRLIMLAIRLMFDSRVTSSTKAALGGGLLYIISPIDLIPDVIPVLGQLEDLALGLILTDMMVNKLDPRVVADHWRGKTSTLTRIGRTTAGLSRFVPGFLRRRALRKTTPSILAGKATQREL